jgi:uncharacterized membrane-anchored protein
MNNNVRITLPRAYQETSPDTYSTGSYLSRYEVGERLPHTFPSHTTYPNFTKGGGVPLLLLLQNVLCVVRVFSSTFIA